MVVVLQYQVVASLALELMHALAVAWSFAVDFFVFDLFRANWVLICLAGVRFP